MLIDGRGVGEGLADGFVIQLRVAGADRLPVFAFREDHQDAMHGQACAADAGLAIEDRGVADDPVERVGGGGHGFILTTPGAALRVLFGVPLTSAGRGACQCWGRLAFTDKAQSGLVRGTRNLTRDALLGPCGPSIDRTMLVAILATCSPPSRTNP